jgi:hypothetical protein
MRFPLRSKRVSALIALALCIPATQLSARIKEDASLSPEQRQEFSSASQVIIASHLVGVAKSIYPKETSFDRDKSKVLFVTIRTTAFLDPGGIKLQQSYRCQRDGAPAWCETWKYENASVSCRATVEFSMRGVPKWRGQFSYASQPDCGDDWFRVMWGKIFSSAVPTSSMLGPFPALILTPTSVK